MKSTPPLSPMATLRWSVVRPVIEQVKPRRILEIGCGQGGFGARLAAMADSYIGVEPTSSPAPWRKNASSHWAARSDATALSDWVTRLAPGGSVLVSVPAWPQRYSTMDRLVGHYRRYTPEALEAALTKAGCTDVRHVFYGWPLGYALEFVRNRIAQRRGSAAARQRGRRLHGGAIGDERATASAKGACRRGSACRRGPFAAVQKLNTSTGTGLLGIGRLG